MPNAPWSTNSSSAPRQSLSKLLMPPTFCAAHVNGSTSFFRSGIEICWPRTICERRSRAHLVWMRWGLFRRKDQVAALESERRAERSFRQEEKEHENDRCRGAARSSHCFARAGAENSVTARRTVRAKCRRHLPRLSDEGMAAAGQLVKAGLPDPPRSWTGKRLGERRRPRRSAR